MNLYSSNEKERLTLFLQTKVLIDTLTIEKAFSLTLEKMSEKANVSIDDIDYEVFVSDEEIISSMFTYRLNGEEVNGYGFMYLKGKALESIWLMPIKRGFSKEYITVFKDRISIEDVE